MASKADGSVLLNTKINTKGIETGISDIQDTMKDLASVTKEMTVQQWVDNYVKGMESASESNNEFKKEVDSLSKKLEDLQSKGLYFGDEEYDRTYLQLQKVNQALKDYKKELISPTKNARIFAQSTMEGQIKKLKDDLRRLRSKGKTFGDEEYDRTAQSLKRAEQSLSDYRRELFKTEEQLQREQAQQERMNQRLEETRQKEAAAAAEAQRLKEIGESAKISNPKIVQLSQELERLKARQADLKKAGVGIGYEEYEQNAERIREIAQETDKYKNTTMRFRQIFRGPGNVFSKLSSILKELRKQTLGVDSAQKKANKSGKKFDKTLKDTKKSANGAGINLKKMLFYGLGVESLFTLLNRIRGAAKEGMGNLAQYSNDTNKALSNLMSAMTRLKNSFAAAFSPLVQFVEPALTRFINLLSQGATYIGKLLAALTGKDYFEQAIGVQQDYAESLDKTKDSAKKAQKQLAAFDELNVLDFSKDEDEDKSQLKPEDMFQTVKIESNIKATAQRIREILKGLFGPLRESWDENGPYVLDSLKYTAGAISKLASDMGFSFMQVWNAEEYGKKVSDDLLITFGNLIRSVGNLIMQFDKAWVSGETGTKILRSIGDLILEVTGFFRKASESIMNWSQTIDFSPLLVAFAGVLIAIRPIVNDVGNLLLWLLVAVLLPIAKWGIEQALPAVFNLIAAALKAIHSVIQALKPLALWFWESFLKPLGEWTGDIIIAALQKLTELLDRFSQWVNENQGTVQNITILIASFFAAWKLKGIIEFLSKAPAVVTSIVNIIGSIKSFQGALSLLQYALTTTNAKFAAIVAVIGTIIYLAVQVARAWDKMTPDEKMATTIIAVAGAIALVVAALAAFTKDYASLALAGAIAAVAGISIAGIAASANKRAAAYASGSGRSSTYPTSAYSAVSYKMPRLATGTVVPPRAGEFAAILGDNKKEPEVVSPLSTMKQALKEALFESGMNGNGEITIKFTGDLAQLARLLRPEIEMEGRRVGVSMVTGG